MAGEHTVISEIDAVNHHAARHKAARHAVERNQGIIEMFHHRPAQNCIEVKATLPKEVLGGIARMIGEITNRFLGRLAVKQVSEVVPFRKRTIDTSLIFGVAARNPAIDCMYMIRPAAEDAECHSEIVARANLCDRAGKTLDPAIGKIITIDSLDICERCFDIEFEVARAGTRRELARYNAVARPPIVKEIIGASERDIAFDECADRHDRNDPSSVP